MKFTGAMVCVLGALGATPGEWPQWGGAQRDFKVDGVELASEWSSHGPPQLWRRPLGSGASAIVTDQDCLYTMYRHGSDEVIVALDATDGKTLWEHRCNPPLYSGIELGFGRGPNATPLVDDQVVCTMGFSGLIHAFDKSTGEQLWAHDVVSGFGATPPQFGYAASPLAHRGVLFILAGGRGRGVMAFDLRSGSVIWSKHDFSNCYASPLLINHDDRESLVVVEDRRVVGLALEDGRLLWEFPHYNSCSGNVSTPLWSANGHLFLSSSPHAGSRMLKLEGSAGHTKTVELWSSSKFKVSQTNAIRLGDIIVASSGTPASSMLAAVSATHGHVLWRTRGFPLANMIHADGKLLILDAEGHLALATATAKELIVHARHQVLEAPSWTVPTLTGRHLFVRDNSHIIAFDVGMTQSEKPNGQTR